MDFPGNVEFDAALRYVDSLPGIGVSSYLVLDLRVGWQATENLEFSIAAQNLLDSKHQEFAPTTIATQPAEIEHSIYGKITWRF